MRVQIPPAARAAVAQRQSNGKTLGPRVPAARVSWCGEGTRYFDATERFGESRRDAAPKTATSKEVVAQIIRGLLVPAGKDPGMVQSRDTSMTTMGGAVSPAAVLIYSSRFEFVGAKLASQNLPKGKRSWTW
jgi:hypothetical protein